MKKLITALLLSATAFASSDQLQRKMEQMAARHQGKVSLFGMNLNTGETVAIDADRPVQTASVIKLPIMLEAFYQLKAGKRKLDEKLTLTKANQVAGSGVLPFLDPGLELTLKDAITLMIIVSDNTATNLVIDAVGLPAVNQRIKDLGLKDTWLYKKVYVPAEHPMPPDQKKFGLGKTTAREMAKLMAGIARCDLGDRRLCDTMIDIMRNQQYRNMIAHYLETVDTSETPSAIADKIGALDRVRNDVALVQTKDGPLVISIFTYDNQDQTWIAENQAEQLIARMAKVIVDTWAPHGLNTAPAPPETGWPNPGFSAGLRNSQIGNHPQIFLPLSQTFLLPSPKLNSRTQVPKGLCPIEPTSWIFDNLSCSAEIRLLGNRTDTVRLPWVNLGLSTVSGASIAPQVHDSARGHPETPGGGGGYSGELLIR